jgi:hypothetical protein
VTVVAAITRFEAQNISSRSHQGDNSGNVENVTTAKTRRESKNKHVHAAVAADLDLLGENTIIDEGFLLPDFYAAYYATQRQSARNSTTKHNANETVRR